MRGKRQAPYTRRQKLTAYAMAVILASTAAVAVVAGTQGPRESIKKPIVVTDARYGDQAPDRQEESPDYAQWASISPYGYTDEDLEYMAKAIAHRAGSEWIPDWVQLDVGSIVLNRVKSDDFPDTIRDVVLQAGQYGLDEESIESVSPDARTVENARRVFNYDGFLPENVLYHGNTEQGDGTFLEYEDEILGTTYFCYMDED